MAKRTAKKDKNWSNGNYYESFWENDAINGYGVLFF